uniref:Uncharacterized protein n=1 Tax=Pristionchus pacificus TaxID=54126 RepID=A0A2A6BTI8_PRIPA|eukprot:PDM69205.1 hypothetical protein PRIPAC_47507 [Pristionchus pacificus]
MKRRHHPPYYYCERANKQVRNSKEERRKRGIAVALGCENNVSEYWEEEEAGEGIALMGITSGKLRGSVLSTG